jgi:phage antirepressor YoqD-like protein
MMKRHYASQDPTLLEIAEVLGIQPEEVLEWTIEGRLLIDLKGSKNIMMLDSNQSLKKHNSGKILILTKQPSTQNWQNFSC